MDAPAAGAALAAIRELQAKIDKQNAKIDEQNAKMDAMQGMLRSVVEGARPWASGVAGPSSSAAGLQVEELGGILPGAVRAEHEERGVRQERGGKCKEYGGKMVIIVTTSLEFNDMFRNWFYSARPFLDKSTQQVVVLAHDKESVASLKELAANLSAPSFDIIDARALGLRKDMSERRLADFKTKEYGALVTQRPLQIMHFLNMGCDVLYSDIDMVWLKDPLVRIQGGEPHGLYLATDEEDGSLKSFCTCFIYARPTNTTNMLMSEWAKRSRGQVQNQPFFNQALRAHGGTFEEAIHRMDIGVLPVWEHPPGCLADNYSNASVLHANWIEGHAKKMEFFKNRSIWHPNRIRT